MKKPLLPTILAALTILLPQASSADSPQAALNEIQLRLIQAQPNPNEKQLRREIDPFAPKPLRKPTGITFDVRFDGDGKMRLKAEGPLAKIRSMVGDSKES